MDVRKIPDDILRKRANVEPCHFCEERYGSKNGELQTFKGYYVDIRCRQFRSKVEYPKLIDFVEFSDRKGMELLWQMHEAVMG